MSSIIETLQEAVADRLESQAAFANVPILRRRDGALTNKLEEATLLASGLGVLILTPIPTAATTGSPPTFQEVLVTVRVLEGPYPVSGPRALELAEAVCRALHNWTPPLANSTGPLLLRSEGPWEYYQDSSRNDTLTVAVRFLTGLAL